MNHFGMLKTDSRLTPNHSSIKLGQVTVKRVSTWEVYESELQAKKSGATLKSKCAIDILFLAFNYLSCSHLNINHSPFGRWLY